MLKHPQKSYIDGRNSYLLKVKPSFDREAVIIGWKMGNGKYKGKLGGLICRPLNNHDTYMSIDEDDDLERMTFCPKTNTIRLLGQKATTSTAQA